MPRTGLLIGITGNIGVGKTFIGQILSKYGFILYLLDNFAKELLTTNILVKDRILKKFPEIFVDKIINKKILRDKIFDNKKNLDIVEHIIHPHTLNKIIQLKNSARQQNRSIVIESALIFHKQRHNYFDIIMKIDSAHRIRLQRVQKRSITTKILNKIFQLQSTTSKNFAKSDFFIYNSSRLHTINLIKKIIHHVNQRN